MLLTLVYFISLMIFFGGLMLGSIFIAITNKRNKRKASEQKLMFNELSKGDYVWKVDERGIKKYLIQRVDYFTNGYYSHNVYKIRIYYSELDYIEIPTSEALSFKYYRWYSTKQGADMEYQRLKNTREKAISIFKETTSQENKKALEELTTINTN